MDYVFALNVTATGSGAPFTVAFGGAPELERSGATRIGGRLPVNPDGGLKAKGHPIGATGASQAYEAFVQLRGEAGPRQVPGAERALAHNVGGAGATATVTIFRAG